MKTPADRLLMKYQMKTRTAPAAKQTAEAATDTSDELQNVYISAGQRGFLVVSTGNTRTIDCFRVYDQIYERLAIYSFMNIIMYVLS